MRVMFACVADFADVNQQGKLNIQGVFDRINAPAFPARHSTMFLVFRLKAEFEDSQKPHKLKIVLHDADNRESLRMEGDMQTPYVPPGAFVSHNQIVRLNDIAFAAPGRYVFAVQVDDEGPFEVPFDVEQA